MARLLPLALLLSIPIVLSACGGGGGRATPVFTIVPTPSRSFTLDDYAGLVESMTTALRTRDGALLGQIVKDPDGNANLWIGGWGGCGAGARVAPMTPENIDAILAGTGIRVLGIAKNDSCPGNPAYGLLTAGWQGKTLPDTYSGEGGPSEPHETSTFTQDEVLLVFWSASFPNLSPRFFGLGAAGPFELVPSTPPTPDP
jgi:hypothetical protein